MYNKSAKFYDALYHFRDYKSASEKLSGIIKKNNPEAKSLLDTACGTGKHIEHLREFYDTEGLDVSKELLEIARQRCPGNTVYQQSMIDFDLGKKYDVVTCLFGSIAYVKTLENLYKSIESMSKHLNPNGLLIFEPWFSKEKYWLDRITANHYDENDLKITWMYTSKLEDDHAVFDINYLIGTTEEVTYFKEKHDLGLFSDQQYRESMQRAGLEIYYYEECLFGKNVGNGLFVGKKTKNNI